MSAKRPEIGPGSLVKIITGTPPEIGLVTRQATGPAAGWTLNDNGTVAATWWVLASDGKERFYSERWLEILEKE